VSTYFGLARDELLPTLSKKTLPNNAANGANGMSARMAGGERRLQILRVAMRLFSQHGFRGTTTKEIAAAAGVLETIHPARAGRAGHSPDVQ